MIWVLFVIAFAWVLFAVAEDFKKREVANWLNYSLLIFALAIRAFYSIFSWDCRPLLFGFFGVAVFFVLGHVFYYSRVFAGGDAKLMIALGAVLPFENNLYSNSMIMLFFVFALLFAGVFYSLFYSASLVAQKRREFGIDFKKRIFKSKNLIFVSLVFAILFLVTGLLLNIELIPVLALIVFIFPYLYIYTKSIEKVCLTKRIGAGELTEGDWLVNDIFVSGRKIEAKWDGVTKKQLKLIQNKYHRKILVKYGIPFTPAFLIALLLVFAIEIFNIHWLLF